MILQESCVNQSILKNHYPVISNDWNINLKIQIGQKFWESWNKLSAMMKRKISVYSTCRSYFKVTVAKTLIHKGQSEAGKLSNKTKMFFNAKN